MSRRSDVLDTWFSSALWPHSTLGWPEQDRGTEILLSDQRADYQPRHHYALGRADGADGPAQRRRSAVPRRFHPSENSRRLRRGDVEVEGQRGRSDRRDREVRGRFAPLRAGLSDDRDAGRADAGRVRMPALPEADRADQAEPHASRRSSASIAARSFRRNGPRSRSTRPCRAGRW